MRTLSAERTYYLRQFENIKFGDTIVLRAEDYNLPPGKEFDLELINLVRHLQINQLELDFLKYNKLYDDTITLERNEKFTVLESNRQALKDAIKEQLKGE